MAGSQTLDLVLTGVGQFPPARRRHGLMPPFAGFGQLAQQGQALLAIACVIEINGAFAEGVARMMIKHIDRYSRAIRFSPLSHRVLWQVGPRPRKTRRPSWGRDGFSESGSVSCHSWK